MQQTLLNNIKFNGIGVHSGENIEVSILPSGIDTGIVFKRVDLVDKDNTIPAIFRNVINTSMCTVIGNDSSIKISTIEHLMSALFACGIDNAIVEVNGEEVPIMDGSAAPFVEMIIHAGIAVQKAKRKIIVIRDVISIVSDNKFISIEPSNKLIIDLAISFPHKAIGEQKYTYNSVESNFITELSKARTFGFIKDLQELQRIGLAKGASLKNAIALSEDKIINDEPLRYQNEFVRHKVLDCLGDMYLAGYRILGHIKAERTGHYLNNQLLHKLFSNSSYYEIVEENIN